MSKQTQNTEDQGRQFDPALNKWLDDTIDKFYELKKDDQDKFLHGCLLDNLDLREAITHVVDSRRGLERIFWAVIANAGGVIGVPVNVIEEAPETFAVRIQNASEGEEKIKVLAVMDGKKLQKTAEALQDEAEKQSQIVTSETEGEKNTIIYEPGQELPSEIIKPDIGIIEASPVNQADGDPELEVKKRVWLLALPLPYCSALPLVEWSSEMSDMMAIQIFVIAVGIVAIAFALTDIISSKL